MGALLGVCTPKEEAGVNTPTQNHSALAVPRVPRKVTIKDFDVIRVIGAGSSAKVLQVRTKSTGKEYAMKVVTKKLVIENDKIQHTKAERAVLSNVKHPFIVNLHYAFQDDDTLNYVMDLCPGGELFVHLKRDGCFNTRRAKLYTAEIACGLDHLHSQGIIYRDLKPENILIDAEGHVRLADFDLCKHTLDENGQLGSEAKTFCGTPEYTAPEMIRGQAVMPYGKGVDWWALGTLLYEMLTGLPPFYDKDLQKMCDKILHHELREHQRVQPDAFHLISQWLQKDPQDRLGTLANDFERIKAHSFFSYVHEHNGVAEPLAWQDVIRRKLTPDWKPLHGQIYIDSEALSIPISCSDSAKLSSSQTLNFAGFTYIKDGSSFAQRTPLPIPRSPGSPAAKNRSNDSNYSNRSSPGSSQGSPPGTPTTPASRLPRTVSTDDQLLALPPAALER